MRTYITTLVLIVFLCSCSQTNDPVDPNPDPVPPTQDTLNGWQKYFAGDSLLISDIAFVSPSKGYISIASKGIYKSVDSGKTWQLMPLPDNAKKIATINFLNSQYGYCVGESFGYTTNGGDSWNFKPIPDNFKVDVWFISASTGFVAGHNGIYKTADTGTTWQKVGPGCIGVQFLNSQVGWATSYSSPYLIYKTEDGGNTWTTKFTNDTEAFFTVFFADINNGWAMGNTTMVKTTDGGNSWQKFVHGTSSGFDIQFLNNQLGYRTEGSKISKTIDGGITWTNDLIQPSKIGELFFLDSNHGWAGGANGAVLRWKN
jgi:photosystem II stability/assembly factor-like uncharacterized protein